MDSVGFPCCNGGEAGIGLNIHACRENFSVNAPTGEGIALSGKAAFIKLENLARNIFYGVFGSLCLIAGFICTGDIGFSVA